MSSGSSMRAVDDHIAVRANFAVFESLPRLASTLLCVGVYDDIVVRDGGALLFRQKHCIYDGDLVVDSIVYPAVITRELLLEVLRTEGVRHIFGNPGSTELPLIDALAGADDLHYVLALQEATAVGIAEGYAQATGRPAFVNLHTSAGLGNAIGALTSAQANQTPLVVTAGQQDYRHIVTDPLLAGDLTGLARSVSKWVHEVRTAGELGTILRRAFHDAMSPPAGPVFVSIPMDLLEDPRTSTRCRRRRRSIAGRWPTRSTSLPTSSRAGRSARSRSSSATRWPPPARCPRSSRSPRRWAHLSTARRCTATACSRRCIRCGRGCSSRPRPR